MCRPSKAVVCVDLIQLYSDSPQQVQGSQARATMSACGMVLFLFCLFLFFETGFLCVVLAALEQVFVSRMLGLKVCTTHCPALGWFWNFQQSWIWVKCSKCMCVFIDYKPSHPPQPPFVIGCYFRAIGFAVCFQHSSDWPKWPCWTHQCTQT